MEITFKDIYSKLENLEQRISPPLTWLSVTDLAKYIKSSESSIRRLVAKNEIPFKRIGHGGKLLFNKKQIDIWLCSGQIHPTKRARTLFADLI